MTWVADEAPRFTKKADTQDKRELWARQANMIFNLTGDKSAAIRKANAAVRDCAEPPPGRGGGDG